MRHIITLGLVVVLLTGCSRFSSDPAEIIASEDIEVVSEPATPDAAPRRGFFGRMFGRGSDDAAVVVGNGSGQTRPNARPGSALVEPASLNAAPVPAQTEETGGGGFFGLFRRNPTPEPDGPEPEGTVPQSNSVEGVLPFGTIARVCEFSSPALGVKIDSRAGFTLYDSEQDGILQRSHFVTGFKDGCARKFTAGLVTLGRPSVYESARYGSDLDDLLETPLTRRYEREKSRICGVRRNRECEAAKGLDALDAQLLFVTAYEYFGNPHEKQSILLGNGVLLASEQAQ